MKNQKLIFLLKVAVELVNLPFWYFLNIICKEGWFVGLVAGARGGCVKVGETVWITLKGGVTEKREGETKVLKSGSKLDQVLGALKRGGLETLYKLCLLLLTWINSPLIDWLIDILILEQPADICSFLVMLFQWFNRTRYLKTKN